MEEINDETALANQVPYLSLDRRMETYKFGPFSKKLQSGVSVSLLVSPLNVKKLRFLEKYIKTHRIYVIIIKCNIYLHNSCHC